MSIALTLALLSQATPPLTQTPILTWSGDPSRSVSINWRTRANEPTSLQWGPGTTRSFTAQANSQRVTLPNNQGTFTYHTARLKNLSPDTAYSYQIAGGAPLRFRTPAATGALRFHYYGDVQTQIGRNLPVAMRAALDKMPNPDFALFAGDLVDSAHSEKEWGEFWSPGPAIFGGLPVIATAGNHEYRRLVEGQPSALSAQWRPQFDYPLNGLPGKGLEETCYFVDIKGVRIVSLNSNRHVAEQAAWFDAMMKKNPNSTTIVTFHHPVYSQAVGRDNPRVRELWDPLFRKHNVPLVLQGHDHTYGRRMVKTPSGGDLAYLVSVVGTKMYKLSEDAKRDSEVHAERTRTFQTIQVDRGVIEYRSYQVDGTLFDQLTLVRQANGSFRRR